VNISRFSSELSELQPSSVLAVRDRSSVGDGRVVLIGEFDVAGVSDYWRVVDRICDRAPSSLDVDVERLTFCDSSGVGALAQTACRCTEAQIDFRVVGVHGGVATTFHVMQASDLFRIEPVHRD
jgi:anti-sigma B factor antagonist